MNSVHTISYTAIMLKIAVDDKRSLLLQLELNVHEINAVCYVFYSVIDDGSAAWAARRTNECYDKYVFLFRNAHGECILCFEECREISDHIIILYYPSTHVHHDVYECSALLCPRGAVAVVSKHTSTYTLEKIQETRVRKRRIGPMQFCSTVWDRRSRGNGILL